MAGLTFSACTDDNNEPEQEINADVSGAYFFNFGSYGNGGASVTRYDFRKDETTNKYFEGQNPEMTINSNIQYANVYNDTIYLMGNTSDELISVDLEFKPTGNAVSEGIEKPRFFVGAGDYLYISCWGADADFNVMPGSYIAVYNTKTRKVEDKIALPGGPEGLAIANGKLYAAFNYKPQVAVIDLSTEEIDYIDLPAVSSYFLKDANENLYVSLVSTYSDPSDKPGLGYINTTTNELVNNYVLDGVSSSYCSVLSANKEMSQFYLTAASWVEESPDNWVQKGAIFSFDPESGEFTEFAGNLTGANGVVANPFNNDVYVLLSASATEAGSVSIYNANGDHQKNITVGISPYWALFLD
ncbi:MAG: hypothetical protein PF495_11380 [Spirochaetales bacterium]|jgi:hypothetical protein|nr:hypothetical protein [Spirochaetales bacterium]